MAKVIETGKTFLSSFKEWKSAMEDSAKGALADTTLAQQFAEWLDRTKFLSPLLEIAALMEARRVDAILLNKLIVEVGAERASELAREVKAEVERRA